MTSLEGWSSTIELRPQPTRGYLLALGAEAVRPSWMTRGGATRISRPSDGHVVASSLLAACLPVHETRQRRATAVFRFRTENAKTAGSPLCAASPNLIADT